MLKFVDPRSNPEPPPVVSREPAAHGEELRELVRLCSVGLVYDVERWIQEGRPIQALTYKRPGKPSVVSPLRTAIRKGHRDLVLLLLCNGYGLDLEGGHWNSLLDEALNLGAFGMVELLLKWGADPTQVRVDSVVDTYKTDLIDRFWRAGVDYTADAGFVASLAHTVNKPLYGWLRRNRSDQRLQDALDVALHEAVVEDKELPVRLLLWAGADPHRKVPDAGELDVAGVWEDADMLSSAAEAAIVWGRRRMFDLVRIASMPDLDRQLARAHDTWTLKALVELRPPSDWSEIIIASIRRMCWRHGLGSTWDARDALQLVKSNEGKLTTITQDELAYLRRGLLDMPGADDFLWLLKWLNKPKNCEPLLYRDLTRTKGVRSKLEALNAGTRYLTPSQKMSTANDRRRRARERKRDGAPGA